MSANEFLDLVKHIEADVVNSKNIFTSEDGSSRKVRSQRLYNKIGDVEYKHRLAEAVKFIGEVVNGYRQPWMLREVMTTDDFPILFGDIFDRQLLAKYNLWIPEWTAYAKRATVNDFKDAKLLLPIYGADGPLDIVPEAAPYPDAAIHEQSPITWHVDKYGRRIPFSWETMINDDMNMLTDMPERLARAARRTEHRLVTALFVDANGPHASFYTAGNANQIKTAYGSLNGDNPPLSVLGIQSGLNVLAQMTDETGEPILRDVVTLVVPPALEITAMNILNAIQIEDSTSLSGGKPENGSTGERRMILSNWLNGRLRVVVDPYIRTLASNANGSTSWFMFADPNYSREAIRIGFLRGHEQPEIWMKSPNAVRVGGGAVSPMSGDFDTDSIEYRIRHVLGVTRVDPKATVASNGSGS